MYLGRASSQSAIPLRSSVLLRCRPLISLISGLLNHHLRCIVLASTLHLRHWLQRSFLSVCCLLRAQVAGPSEGGRVLTVGRGNDVPDAHPAAAGRRRGRRPGVRPRMAAGSC